MYEKIWEQLLKDNIVRKEIADRLSTQVKSLNIPMRRILKNLGLSSSQISHYLSFQETISDSSSYFEGVGIIQENRFEEYEILEEIARGGMGVVYKAKEKNGRIVALKILLSSMLKSDMQRQRFYREAEVVSSLNHPNIIPLYRMGEHKNCPFLTMKYIEGKTLEQHFDQQNLPLEQGLDLICKIAYALHYAHQKKIIHRDIKASNILIDELGVPYLLDFGLAKIADQASVLTQTGSKLGTPYYMSPEQVKGRKRSIKKQSDIYSLGVVLYQHLTNQLPFEGKTVNDLYHNILNEDPLPPKKEVDCILLEICHKAMSKNPRHRYQNAKKFAYAIEDYHLKNSPHKLYALWKNLFRKYKRNLVLGFSILFCISLSILLCLKLSQKPKKKFTKKNPKEIKIEIKKHLQEAQKRFASKDYQKASEHIEKLLKLKSNHIVALKWKGKILEKWKKIP